MHFWLYICTHIIKSIVKLGGNIMYEIFARKYFLYLSCHAVLKELDKCNQLPFDECEELINVVSVEEVFVELEGTHSAERFNGGLRRSSNTHTYYINHHYEDLSIEFASKIPQKQNINPIGFNV